MKLRRALVVVGLVLVIGALILAVVLNNGAIPIAGYAALIAVVIAGTAYVSRRNI